MPTKILVFDPLDETQVRNTENELNTLFEADWEIISSTSIQQNTDNDVRNHVVLILTEIRHIPVLPQIKAPAPERSSRDFGFRWY